MMGITELRIGNYVTNKKGERVFRVDKLIEDDRPGKKATAWDVKQNMIGIGFEMFKPIPLTEEWMVRLWFIKKIKSWYRTDMGSIYMVKPYREAKYYLVKSNGGDKISSV